ncbi:MAG TPA: histone H1 [Planctomycetota bacterium]|nr:histone H1 [Planctomycetota bacterium]
MGVEKYDELSRLVAEARTQFEEFKGGKKVAAMRARKLLQQIKKLAQECRIEVQELKKPKGEVPPPPVS